MLKRTAPQIHAGQVHLRVLPTGRRELVDGEHRRTSTPHTMLAPRASAWCPEPDAHPRLSVVENVALFLPDLPHVPDLKSVAKALESLASGTA